MNILFLLPNDKLGGAEQYLKLLAEHYLKNNSKVSVVFLQNQQQKGWEHLLKHKNITFKYNSSNKISTFISLVFFFITHRVNYNYIYTSHVKATGLMGLFIKLRLLRVNYFIARESTSIFTRYKGLKLFVYKCYYRVGYSSVNLLICQTEFMRKQLLFALPYLEEKTIVIDNPIDLKLIKEKQKEVLQNNYENYIVSAGRLIPEKGYDILIKVFGKIAINFPERNLKLILLGEGAEENNLKKIVVRNNLTKKVIFKGFVNNVYPYFKNAELCVVSSRIEGFPNVLLQMMSQNSKVVSTLCAGGIDLIKGVVTCLTNDEDSLEKALTEALNNNTENKDLFNNYLKNRTVENFLKKIHLNLCKT